MNGRDFKIGDRVRIRQWDDMEREFGKDEDGCINLSSGFGFVDSMHHLCGRTATILEYSNSEVYLDFDDKSGDIEWAYTTDMLEHINQDEQYEISVTCHGNKIVAKYGDIICEEECESDSSYDFTLKAELAFEQLMIELRERMIDVDDLVVTIEDTESIESGSICRILECLSGSKYCIGTNGLECIVTSEQIQKITPREMRNLLGLKPDKKCGD